MRNRGEKAPTKLSALFEVYKKRLRAPQGSVIAAAVEIIHDVLNVSIDARVCEYSPQSRILRINANGPLKSEIFLRKDEILTHLKGRLGTQNAPTQIL